MRLKWHKLDTIVEGAALGTVQQRTALGAVQQQSALGSSATAVTGFVAATVALLVGDLYIAGLCLVAALSSLGLLANAVFIGIRPANERSHEDRWPVTVGETEPYRRGESNQSDTL